MGISLMSELLALWTSLKLSLIVTLILFIVCLPLSYQFSRIRSLWGSLGEVFFSLPLVLPPTVLGFYFLILFSPHAPLGQFLKETFSLNFIFTFHGLVLASCLYSLPFMFQPLKAGFEKVERPIVEAAYTLGKSKWETFLFVQLPMVRPSLLTALAMTFAHTMGEFGVVLMIGGNIPGVTRVASVSIYENVESLNYTGAHFSSILMIALSFSILLFVQILNGRAKRRESFD